MKKFFSVAVACVAFVALQAQTADEVINKYITAAGGKDKLEAINTLQYVRTINLNSPMGEIQITMTNIKVENKLSRTNTSSEFFGNAYSLFTDTSGWIMIPPNQFTGTEEIRQKLKPEEYKAMKSEMACEGYFPELVNYAAKGYTAEYVGEGKSNGKASYKIKLKKNKDERTYFIDKQTGLVNSMTVKGAAAVNMTGMGAMAPNGGGRADKMEVTLDFSDYKETAGVKFPGKLKIETPMGVIESTISFVTINQPVDAKWYRAD
jgi:hypothetical protein